MGTTTTKIAARYYKFANIALQLAEEANNSMTHSLCAILVRKNKVLSVGYNSRKTSPRMATKMNMVHAELSAILRCPENDLRGCDIIVARARSEGRSGLARPCGRCQDILRRVGIRRVIYTTNFDDLTTMEVEKMRL